MRNLLKAVFGKPSNKELQEYIAILYSKLKDRTEKMVMYSIRVDELEELLANEKIKNSNLRSENYKLRQNAGIKD